MSIERVKSYLKKYNMDEKIIELETSSATVDLAAKALGTEPDRIAKTIALRGKEDNTYIILVTAGNAKIDNKKFKGEFSTKARMLSFDETKEFIGYPVGGVCPFDLECENIKTYLDISLKKYETVFPACGSTNSAIELSPDELDSLTHNPIWVNVCK